MTIRAGEEASFKHAEVFRCDTEIGSDDLLRYLLKNHRTVFHHSFEAFAGIAVDDGAFLEFMAIKFAVGVMEHEYSKAVVGLNRFPEILFGNAKDHRRAACLYLII